MDKEDDHFRIWESWGMTKEEWVKLQEVKLKGLKEKTNEAED